MTHPCEKRPKAIETLTHSREETQSHRKRPSTTLLHCRWEPYHDHLVASVRVSFDASVRVSFGTFHRRTNRFQAMERIHASLYQMELWLQMLKLGGAGFNAQQLANVSDEEYMMSILEKKNQQSNNTNSRTKKKRVVIDQSREEGHNRLFNDYFSTSPVYTDAQFRRRFRMHRHVFDRIVTALGTHDEYFQRRVDATGRTGLSPLQKCTAAIRILAYGSPADSVDDYVRIGESTAVECLGRFVHGVCTLFGEEYLRRPNSDDTERLLKMGEARGFLVMIGSIDCMHWEWKNCPVAWKGQFQRDDHAKPTIMLEAVASQDLWIWHTFFGVADSNNDNNVLNQSNV